VQISATVKKPRGIRLTASLLEAAVQRKLADPKLRDPKGFKLRIVWWQNPSRNPEKINLIDGKPLNARRDYGPQFERWDTLRRALQHSRMAFRKMGKG
jgi:hypothetical protein